MKNRINLGSGTMYVKDMETEEVIESFDVEDVVLEQDTTQPVIKKRKHDKLSVMIGKAIFGTSFKKEIGDEFFRG